VADRSGYEWGTGRRKTSVARVRIRKGSGMIVVNGRDYSQYFPGIRHRRLVEGAMKHIGVRESYDVFANIRGGGITGQAGALVMGLGRALAKAEPEHRSELSQQGYLSRDSRMVERKKPGKPGARKSFQFSKR
jgi:small subunit ribosomal protein S9